MLNTKISSLFIVFSLVFSNNIFAGEESKVDNKPVQKLEVNSNSLKTLGEPLVVLKSTFGLINFEPTGKSIFTPSKTIPFVEKQAYGWIIKINSNKKLKWREEIIFPEAPSLSLITSKKLKMNTDGNTAIFEKEVTPINGVIHNQWIISKYDIKGKYTINVFAEQKLLKSFDITVK